MAVNINYVPFNSIPREWAFHPTIGPFVRDVLQIIFQQRTRTGGDADYVADLLADIIALDGRLDVAETGIVSLDARVDALEAATVYSNSVEHDFGSTPVYDAQFTITDANITNASVVTVVPGGAATGRTADDWQWDGAIVGVVTGSGSATCYVTFHPGPIVGRRSFNYTVS